MVVTETWLDRLCRRVYPEEDATPYDMLGSADPTGEVESTSDTEYDVVDPAKLAMGTKLPPIIRLVNLILRDTASAGASDVHIEPQEGSRPDAAARRWASG